jgi:hypothetical protein
MVFWGRGLPVVIQVGHQALGSVTEAVAVEQVALDQMEQPQVAEVVVVVSIQVSPDHLLHDLVGVGQEQTGLRQQLAAKVV